MGGYTRCRARQWAKGQHGCGRPTHEMPMSAPNPSGISGTESGLPVGTRSKIGPQSPSQASVWPRFGSAFPGLIPEPYPVPQTGASKGAKRSQSPRSTGTLCEDQRSGKSGVGLSRFEVRVSFQSVRRWSVSKAVMEGSDGRRQTANLLSQTVRYTPSES